jgi:hypothetical protein
MIRRNYIENRSKSFSIDIKNTKKDIYKSSLAEPKYLSTKYNYEMTPNFDFSVLKESNKKKENASNRKAYDYSSEVSK